MMEHLKISIDRIYEIASALDSLNNHLCNELMKSVMTVENLTVLWDSEVAYSVVVEFNDLVKKVYPTHKNIIDAYVQFLRQTADAFSKIDLAVAEALNK